jgi:hypothetical protein
MAKDQKPADQMDAFSKQAMAQAHEALDTYFDFLKKSVSAFPSGGTDLGEKLKEQSQHITAMHELAKSLSRAKDFEEALRIQTAFNAFATECTWEASGKSRASIGAGSGGTPISPR